MNNEPSVKDVLDYEALPQEIRDLAERYWEYRVKIRDEEINIAYDEGYKDGERDAECNCEPDADLQDEVDELRTKVTVLEDEIEKLKDYIQELEDVID